jgi:DNA-binding Lrp family transcriptional regulator
MVGIDAIDRKILHELQIDGRLTLTELAARVHLSVAACHRRYRELERLRVIVCYHAEIAPAAVGWGFEALVSITMDRENAATIDVFEEAVALIPKILQAERLFGDPDYSLRVVAPDLQAFATLRDTIIATLPGIARVTSTIVMRQMVHNRPLPLA